MDVLCYLLNFIRISIAILAILLKLKKCPYFGDDLGKPRESRHKSETLGCSRTSKEAAWQARLRDVFIRK